LLSLRLCVSLSVNLLTVLPLPTKKTRPAPRLSVFSVACLAQAEQSVSAVAARDMFAKAKLKNEREQSLLMAEIVTLWAGLVKKSSAAALLAKR